MKKLCLLSGMIILSAVTGLTAMESQRVSRETFMEFQRARLALNQATANAHVDWDGVFRVLDSYRDRMSPSDLTYLVNNYRDYFDGDRLLMSAVLNNKVQAARRLLQDFNAQVTTGMLKNAKKYGPTNNEMLDLLYQYGGAQLK